MRNLSRSTATKVKKHGTPLERCSIRFFLLGIYRLYRFIFVSIYYYLMPFMILIFPGVIDRIKWDWLDEDTGDLGM